MGANATQGTAVAAFLAGCCIIPISAFFGGILTAAVGLGLIGVSIALFQKCKPWENAENGGVKLMVAAGLLVTLLGFAITVASLGVTEAMSGRLIMTLLGIAVSLFGILGILNQHYLKTAIWKKEVRR